MGHVALTLDGRYVRLGQDEHHRLRMDGTAVDSDAVFERLELGHGRVALRTVDGCFLAVRPDGLSFGVHAEPELTPAAAFEEILWPTGQVSLRTCHLTYVGAGAGGRIAANRTEAGLRERFSPVAVATLPGQRPSVVDASGGEGLTELVRVPQ